MDSYSELREAQQWALQLQSANATARQAFAEWVMASTDHLKAFLITIVLDEELKRKHH